MKRHKVGESPPTDERPEVTQAPGRSTSAEDGTSTSGDQYPADRAAAARTEFEDLEDGDLPEPSTNGHRQLKAADDDGPERMEDLSDRERFTAACDLGRLKDAELTIDHVLWLTRFVAPEKLAEAAAKLPIDHRRMALSLRDELYNQRIRRTARELLDREEREAAHSTADPPRVQPLPDLLDEPDDEVTYRIAGLWPMGGRVVLSGPHKAGKSTLVGNLIRCLVDGDDFLGAHAVEERAGRVVLIDNELDRRMLRRWLRDQGIVNDDRVGALMLRGRVASFDLLDDATRAEWAAELSADGPPDVVVFDCLRPALDSLGLSEDKEAGRFLDALGELAYEAGAGELLVVHHMGHTAERSRGDSRIQDWPDALWKLVREDHDRPTYFTAYGRDVEVGERELAMNAETRHLTVVGGGRKSKPAAAAGRDEIALKEAVSRFVADHPGASGNDVQGGVKGKDTAIRAALKELAIDGYITREDGPRRSKLHTSVRPFVAADARAETEFAAAAESTS